MNIVLDNQSKIELENQIHKFIQEDNPSGNTVHFDYDEDIYHMIKLTVFTYNPIHRTTFVFLQGCGKTKESALKDALLRLSAFRKAENSYTVEWCETGKETHISYFKGRDILEVLDKFFYKKNKTEYQIFLIKLNPIS